MHTIAYGIASMRVWPAAKLLIVALTVRRPDEAAGAAGGRGLLVIVIGDLPHRVAASRIQRGVAFWVLRPRVSGIRSCCGRA
jgi:hypothetical protein